MARPEPISAVPPVVPLQSIDTPMFENLTDRLNHTITQLRGQGRLTEDNIKQTLREVRMALLEADVALPVVKDFIDGIRERAVGAEVMQSLTPGPVSYTHLTLPTIPLV